MKRHMHLNTLIHCVFSVDVLLSCHECHHLHLPPSLGTQPLCALHPRPLSFSAGLV